jgi:hypothetical protein
VQPHLPRVRHHGALPRRALLLVSAVVRGVPARGTWRAPARRSW